MRSQRELGSSGHAITDLYDEQRRTFLVQYPIWLITVLGLVGVAAFAVTGFLGYSDNYAGGDQTIRQLTQANRTVFFKIGYAWVL